ncbi:MAG TPA: UXX-star (seleno)protein family 1 [Syntrophales bacterium]|jgi:glutaredoxin 3|nr:UXX-star (seleno)protein family 1 [Syntrophales bacterium]HPC33683.1 UXX-star (seleno)protein family 1 [Syntrophales bacterium]HQG35456.1 UXX-star (seleno)protein family 1 [Syntrophales bacterium]HQI36343.1 UXX-star (seleno)protein family 1 [Syntrophales bacterium]HQJ31099.1 UXX-star (seleno)protein family 1 [Syntrophales bacterium]
MEKEVIIYGTDTCPFCNQAREAYGDRAVYINVDKDSAKLTEMLKLSGGRKEVPVIVEGGKVTVGFHGEATLRGAVPLFGGT